jgi:hypothetical protein
MACALLAFKLVTGVSQHTCTIKSAVPGLGPVVDSGSKNLPISKQYSVSHAQHWYRERTCGNTGSSLAPTACHPVLHHTFSNLSQHVYCRLSCN